MAIASQAVTTDNSFTPLKPSTGIDSHCLQFRLIDSFAAGQPVYDDDLVVYIYGAAGVTGLPRSAARLEEVARPVSLHELEPGDLLFFRLSRKKTSHVAIYVGDRSFVHAPSSGKQVEKVSFDHVYWSEHLGRAGRL